MFLLQLQALTLSGFALYSSRVDAKKPTFRLSKVNLSDLVNDCSKLPELSEFVSGVETICDEFSHI